MLLSILMQLQVPIDSNTVNDVLKQTRDISVALYAFAIVIFVLIAIIIGLIWLIYKIQSKADGREELTVNFAQQLLGVAQEFKNIVNNVNTILEQKTEILSTKWELSLANSLSKTKEANEKHIDDTVRRLQDELDAHNEKMKTYMTENTDKFKTIIGKLEEMSKK